MKYKHTEWYMEKSFADFEQLQETLVYQEFTDVPLLPDLQLSHGIDTLGELCNSELALEKFIREVLRRPDTRACIDVLTFCDLLRRLDNAPAPVFATLLTETPCCHLAVSDVQYLQDDRLMIVSHEEKTALSKIGRMWTIIEPDTLGVVRVYRIEDNVTDGCTQILHKIFHNKVRGVEYVRESKTLIVAKDDGYAELFRLDEDATNFDVIGTLALHCGPILSISVRDGLCFTSGYDDSIRVFDVERQKTLSGGKLTRRLNGEKLLVSEATSPRTMFIGELPQLNPERQQQRPTTASIPTT
ncbi:WD domain, G-beta repeat-containing protein [Babesia caballi]|uniref:WD domain, G-beta repeat-containing protein n=1 Tax=Babesia caballi TaxID=5871 RepID=A0AAV4LW36_BABCB|nr:WD domain, G-beta repeat-containing protein [Babesia caballi]